MNSNVDLGSFILQLISLQILFRDYNNTDLMQELQKQDTEYFEKLIENQEKILQILNERENNYDRKN